jgi:hypothetical protein
VSRPALVVAVLVVATLGKLALAWVAGDTADVRQYLQQARAFLSGADVFDPRSTASNPSFFLIGHYALAALTAVVADATGLPFRFWIKVPAILGDLGAALLLCRMPRAGDLAAIAYIANPITLLLSVHHGQFHSVATAVAAWAVERGVAGHATGCGVLLGLAASVRQHFGAFVVPILVSRSERNRGLVTAFLAVMIGVNLPLLVTSAHLWRAAAPVSTPGIWGYSIPLIHAPGVLALMGWHLQRPVGLSESLARHGGLVLLVWTVMFLAWVVRRRETDAWRAALLFLLGIYAVAPAFGVQWLVWALPFWLVVDARGAMGYSVLGGLYLAGTYWVWTFPARYGVRSITADLGVLSPGDLALYFAVGGLGVVTWLHCARTAWRLATPGPPRVRAPASE